MLLHVVFDNISFNFTLSTRGQVFNRDVWVLYRTEHKKKGAVVWVPVRYLSDLQYGSTVPVQAVVVFFVPLSDALKSSKYSLLPLDYIFTIPKSQ